MLKEINNKLLALGFEVVGHTDAMLAYWDKNLICRFANNAYIEWYGIDPETMIDKITIEELLGPFFENNLPYIKGVLDGKVQVFERETRIPSGQTKHSIATYCPDFENGKVKGFYVHVADISFLRTPTSLNHINNFEIDESHMPSNEKSLNEVIKSLKSSLSTGFPGISHLSKQYFISESKLKRDFKSKFNTTIFSYYRNLQMELADKYINEKKYNKKQIAAIFNFSNPSNFSVCYRKYLKENATKKTIEEIQKNNDQRYKTFIAQAPFAIAMLDNGMRYLAASQKWIEYYNLQNKELNGVNYYEIFPDTELKWKDIHAECLNGRIHNGEEAFFESENESPTWLRWDIRPWHNDKEETGGLLVFIEDITNIKLKEAENKKILEVFNKTNEIARIGSWERNFRNNTSTRCKITKEILEFPDNFNPDLETAFNLYKEGASRELAKKALNDAFEKGQSFDIEVEITTAKGNLKWVRVIGYPEFYNGKCEKLFGILQDISNHMANNKKSL